LLTWAGGGGNLRLVVEEDETRKWVEVGEGLGGRRRVSWVSRNRLTQGSQIGWFFLGGRVQIKGGEEPVVSGLAMEQSDFLAKLVSSSWGGLSVKIISGGVVDISARNKNGMDGGRGK